jgi:hypothetical protein
MAFCTNCGTQVTSDFCTRCGTRIGASAPPPPQRPAAPPVYAPPARNAPAYQSPPAGQAVPGKKKLGPWVWILGGCFGLIVVAGVIAISAGFFVANKVKQAGLDPALIEKNPGLAVAKMMVSANPELEMVSIDENKGIIKVREKKTGKTLIVNLAAAKEGKFEFQDESGEKIELDASGSGDSGTVTIKGSKGTMQMGGGLKLPAWVPSYPGAQETGSFGINADDSNAGTMTFKSADSADQIAAFYENALKGTGFAVEKTALNASGQPAILFVTAKDKNSDKSVQVTATTEAQGTTVGVTYGTK